MKPVLSRPVRIEGIGQSGSRLTVEASPDELRELAEENGLESISRLEARLELMRHGRSVLHVRGTVRADVVYRCVVTLEPVPGRVEEEIDIRFRDGHSPESAHREVTVEAEDPPEPAPGGVADVGAIVAEHFTLGLDPYPRAAGASLDEIAPKSAAESPFAALLRLRNPPDAGQD